MANKAIATDKAPAAIGPYSQGIEGCGTAVYVSGQLGLDPATGDFPGDDIVSQTHQSIKNVQAILQGAGYDLCDVVKTTVLLKDIADFATMNEIYGQYFTEPFPARAAFQAVALPKGGLVEIEAVAMK